jgi:hypothetical protein
MREANDPGALGARRRLRDDGAPGSRLGREII